MRNWLVWLALALGAAATGAAWAQGGPGVQFLTVVGDVRVVGPDGAQRPAERGAELRDGETIQTGANALAQLRLADGSLLSVRADTELKLDRFSFAGRDDRSASFVVSLLKGGFRSITGLIGTLNRDGYRITTPSATIGIRGTDFDTLVLPAARPDLQMDAGTFARVHRGEIVVQNRQLAPQMPIVQQIVRPDQTGFVGLGGNAPQLVPVPALLRAPTPVVQAPPPAPTTGAGPGAAKGEGARTGQTLAPGTRPIAPGATREVLVNPIQQAPTTTIQTAPSTLQTAPITSPVLTAPTTTIQTAPSTLQTAPLTSPILTAPTTIQTAPTTIQTAPITSPVLTAPTTIQTAPIQTAPITAPIQTAPSTTIQSPAMKAPIAPMITKP